MPQSFAEQFRSIPMSSNLGESLERARGFSRAQAHRSVLLEHLLLALIEDPDAAGVLRASNVDAVRLGTDVSDYLGRLLEDMRAEPGTEPHPDVELLRVLQAAGQAAQQSRRRQIDGAIVLAAIVGDGKSPAAGLLKTLGLSFEEAIKALQKASAQARSKQYAAPPPAAASRSAAPIATESALPPPPSEPAPSSEPALPSPEAPQTVEEILAAARARIQRRTAAIVGRPEPPIASAEALPPLPEPEPPVLSEQASPGPPAPALPQYPVMPETKAPAMPAAPPVRSPAGPSLAPLPRPGWTPVSPLPKHAGNLPQPGPKHAPLPFPPQSLQSTEGPARPPLSHRGGPAFTPQPGLPNRPPGAPWPDPAEPPRPPANGAAAGPAGRLPPSRPGQRPGAGPLVETIPRRMRVGVPSPAQVRISRDKIDGLILLLMGHRGTAPRPAAFLTRALSVRLIAPEGGFWIEAGSPETQWVDRATNAQQDDHASWRWTVTPHRRGRYRLLLVVTARTVGHDGLATDTAPPDRVIDVTVNSNLGHRAAGWVRLLAAVLFGALIGRYGSEIWAMGTALLKRLIGG